MQDEGDPDVGEWGEAVAEKFLRRAGYKILGLRVRFGPRAELDIVARDGKVLVFVEVKARKGETFGRPFIAVDTNKRRVISRAAMQYLKTIKYPSVHMRFDVIEVVGTPDGREPEVRHIENAFQLDKKYSLPF